MKSKLSEKRYNVVYTLFCIIAVPIFFVPVFILGGIDAILGTEFHEALIKVVRKIVVKTGSWLAVLTGWKERCSNDR
jgi:hypothetical protein